MTEPVYAWRLYRESDQRYITYVLQGVMFATISRGNLTNEAPQLSRKFLSSPEEALEAARVHVNRWAVWGYVQDREPVAVDVDGKRWAVDLAYPSTVFTTTAVRLLSMAVHKQLGKGVAL